MNATTHKKADISFCLRSCIHHWLLQHFSRIVIQFVLFIRTSHPSYPLILGVFAFQRLFNVVCIHFRTNYQIGDKFIITLLLITQGRC